MGKRNDWDKHNRQQKAQKPDYLEELAHGTDIKSTPASMATFKEEQQFKVLLIERYRKGGFAMGGYHWKFTWTFEEFYGFNKLQMHDNEARQLFENIMLSGKKDLEIIIQYIRAYKPDLLQEPIRINLDKCKTTGLLVPELKKRPP